MFSAGGRLKNDYVFLYNLFGITHQTRVYSSVSQHCMCHHSSSYSGCERCAVISQWPEKALRAPSAGTEQAICILTDREHLGPVLSTKMQRPNWEKGKNYIKFWALAPSNRGQHHADRSGVGLSCYSSCSTSPKVLYELEWSTRWEWFRKWFATFQQLPSATQDPCQGQASSGSLFLMKNN